MLVLMFGGIWLTVGEGRSLADVPPFEKPGTACHWPPPTFLRAYSAKSDVPTFETLAVTVPKPHVFHVELNRPKKLNTFNIAMWKELHQCFSSLSENPECRVVVLSGQGKHFTAGIDLSSLVEMHQKINEIEDVARKCRFTSGFIKMCQDGISALEECRKPVLSVIHNACIGAGVDLITAADVRYCTEDSFFQVTEVDVGLAADVGTLQRLPKEADPLRGGADRPHARLLMHSGLYKPKHVRAQFVSSSATADGRRTPKEEGKQRPPNRAKPVINNMSVARELCFTARKFDAKEASQLGLVSKVFPDKDSALKNALEVAENIAAKVL
ncbi:Delta(3,5)-Delta(2,4)-dienoyl-CoA isomerase, mitochondrial [Eumeta japonica]|uniref:Delta(3,5)-Delta(2,4)-dienoyl-CoA isomerase, mitochondrial n=1 Tax=Eumeta variegata TaxID=151549 RepID=A0A4C1SIW0_EUMVA|nr:Delta(3,5)-Delta(2,4)-dienoyl-CoA isomerase, mitochondrial [Eumeta japonica]